MVLHYLQFTPETQRSISMILGLGSWVLLLRLGTASGPLLKSVCVICKFELSVCYTSSLYSRFRDINYMCVYYNIFCGEHKSNHHCRSCPSPPVHVVSTKQQREKYRQRLFAAFETHYHPDHSIPRLATCLLLALHSSLISL